MAASLTLFDVFFEDIVTGVHDFTPTTGDSFFVYLSSEAPTQPSDELKADIAEIAAGNGYTAEGNEAVIQQVSQTAGVCRIIASSPDAWVAAAGGITPFRYAILYNGSTTKKIDPLIGYWDNGSTVTLAEGDSFSLDVDPTIGIIALS